MGDKFTVPSISHWSPAMSPTVCVWGGVGNILTPLGQSQVRRKHITSCNYKMLGEKKKGKEKEQLFLLLETKTNQLRRVL